MGTLRNAVALAAASTALLAASCQAASQAEAPSAAHPQTTPLTTAARETPTQPDCEPGIRLHPRSGPVGTRLRITGCAPRWLRAHLERRDLAVWLMHDFAPRCQLSTGGGQLGLAADHSVRGWLVVHREGPCKQQPYKRRTTPAVYHLVAWCQACIVQGATFRVTGS